jgi:predicted RNA binding protein YcfA (HicA-like mRNA interferase family)
MRAESAGVESCANIEIWACIDPRYNPCVQYRQRLRMLQDDGWGRERTTGSHKMYIHLTKPGPVVVPAGGKEGQDVRRGRQVSCSKG